MGKGELTIPLKRKRAVHSRRPHGLLFIIPLLLLFSTHPDAAHSALQSKGQEQQKRETGNKDQIDDPFKKGRSIMEEVERRAKSVSEHLFLTMIIRDSAGKERKRALEVWNEYNQDGRRKNLMRFTSPQMVRNTGLLSLEREAGEDDQWLYLPILRKSKRIAASAKTNEFVGTDFTFEDLSAENIDDFKYEFQGEQETGGHTCFVVKAIPLESRAKSTGYSERIIFIRKDIYAPVMIQHYDWDGKFYKKWLASDLVHVKDECWRANREEMIKVIENKCTILLIDRRISSDTLDNAIFTQRELTKEY
ncbi:MAG: outer membrane lipoprotein-sorting protein [bacterium]